MAGNYPGDVGGAEDLRLSSLRSSLISPNAAYLQQQAQQQQWQHGSHSSSWNTSPDTDYDFNNPYPLYQQQQQWMFRQFPQSDEHTFTPQHGPWGSYEAQGQQALGSSGHDVTAMNQAAAEHQANNNEVEVDGNIGKDSQGHKAPNGSVSSKKHHLPGHDVLKTDNTQVKTPPSLTEHELKMKRAAAIASLQKRTGSAGTSGRDNTPSRGASRTPTQTATQGDTNMKDGKSNGTQRSLFQTGDKTHAKREISSTERSSPVESTVVSQHLKSSRLAAAEKTPSEQPFRSQKQDDSDAQNDKMHAKASSIDIDGLLAEGRAAAEASIKPGTNGKQGSGKAPDAEVGSHRRNSRPRAVSSEPSEAGEIRDETEERISPRSKPKGAIPKDQVSGIQKSQNPGSSNGLSKNPTTKTDSFIDDKGSKQDTSLVGSLEKRRSGTESGVPKKSDSTPQASGHSPFQSFLGKGEKTSVSKVELRSTEKGKKAQGSHSRPDRPVYEPARDSSRYKVYDQTNKESKENESDNIVTARRPSRPNAVDVRSSGDSQKPAVGPKPRPSNSFAHLDPHEVEELKEWLVVTGYYDETFRRKTMHRYKRLAALEQEKAELLKEEQEERGALTTARANSFMSLDAPGTPATPGLSYLATMPPLKPGQKHDKAPTALNPSDDRIDATNNASDSTPKVDDSRASRTTPLKRRLSVSVGHDSDPKPAEKLARTGYETHVQDDLRSSQERRQESSRSHHPKESRDSHDDGRKLTRDKPTMDGMNEERREALNHHRSPDSRSPDRRGNENEHDRRYSRESNRMRRDWLESPEHKDSGSFSGRGRGRGRFHRGSHRGGAFFKPHRSDRKDSGDELDLHLGNVQYFLVKSWTYENVEISQREGTWATQAKNVEKFLNAFGECRHVILVFSVNNSKAFQGYARMETRPGAKGVRTPSWAEELVWEPSPPFKIRWISVNETRFRYVGHLKNSYNEDAPVLVGRDGQDIEPSCGQSLCEIIADEDPNHSWVKPHKPMSYKTW